MIISHERKNSYISHNTTLAHFSLTLLTPIGAVDKVILKRKIQSLNSIIIFPHSVCMSYLSNNPYFFKVLFSCLVYDIQMLIQI